MMKPFARIVVERAARFDVVCLGEALWELAIVGGTSRQAPVPRFRPSGGAVDAAIAIARNGLRVGLAATIGDDAPGRALLARVEAAGVDVGGVALAPPPTGLAYAEVVGATHRIHPGPERDEDAAGLAVPEAWAARVLLISGLSPALGHAAAVCKAARAARRAGAIVVVDVNARWHLWAGRDPRAARAVLREAHVVRCSMADLAGLGTSAAAVRSAMRAEATLVLTDGARAARACGPFGEVAEVPESAAAVKPSGAGDAFTAAIVTELARADDPGTDRVDLWRRALRRGHVAARARTRRN